MRCCLLLRAVGSRGYRVDVLLRRVEVAVDEFFFFFLLAFNTVVAAAAAASTLWYDVECPDNVMTRIGKDELMRLERHHLLF
jgi:hypothetical protein